MIGILIALGVVAALLVVLWFMSRGSTDIARKDIYEKVEECQKLSKGDASARKDAIIRMDTLLGRSLQYAGVKGETVGERLKNARNLFNRQINNDIWEAHKIRNTIVHEHREVSQSETDRAMSTLTSAIRRLVK